MRWPINELSLLGLAGAAVGSFVGAAVERLDRRESLTWCRSKCASCGSILTARDLIPLLSYCWLRGRCRFCQAHIPASLLGIELAAVLATLASQLVLVAEFRIVGMLFVWTLLALAWFDWQTGRLPDFLTVPLGLAGLAWSAFAHAALLDHVIGAAIGLLVPTVIAGAYRHVRGQDGLGQGDIKLFGAVGAWTGLQAWPFVLLFASAGCLLFCVATGRTTSRAPIRFGPFIAAAAWLVWVWPHVGWTQ
jgi:leader peptidase (prepilin peptidase) / N-methyltransferase